MSTLSEQAHTILATASQGTHRPLVAWATGTVRCRHAAPLVHYWNGGGPLALAPEHAGMTLDRGRMLTLTRRQIQITGPDLPTPIRLTWRDVAEVLERHPVAAELISACTTAMRERAAVVKTGELGTQWARVERACAMAAQAVWAECRPSDPGEQLDLFTAASLP